MFGIGTTEILVIAVVALLVLGPEKLPGILRSLGKGLAEFRRMSNDVKSTLNAEVYRYEQEERQKETPKASEKPAAKAAPEPGKPAPQAAAPAPDKDANA